MKRAASSSALRGNGSGSDALAAAVLTDPHEVGKAGFERARHLHSQLLGVVDTLNDKVASVLAKQEKEFLRAYRAHMYTVQRELQTLRAKADEGALQLARDEKVKALEAERDWYRAEALRLDRFSTSLKGELTYLRDKLGALEDERDWMESELKTARRKVQVLQAGQAQARGEQEPAQEAAQEEGESPAKPRPRLNANRAHAASTRQGAAEGKSPSREGREAASPGSVHSTDEALLATRSSAELFALLVPPGTPGAVNRPATSTVPGKAPGAGLRR